MSRRKVPLNSTAVVEYTFKVNGVLTDLDTTSAKYEAPDGTETPVPTPYHADDGTYWVEVPTTMEGEYHVIGIGTYNSKPFTTLDYVFLCADTVFDS